MTNHRLIALVIVLLSCGPPPPNEADVAREAFAELLPPGAQGISCAAHEEESSGGCGSSTNIWIDCGALVDSGAGWQVIRARCDYSFKKGRCAIVGVEGQQSQCASE